MVAGQVKATGAARNGQAVAQASEPFVVADKLADVRTRGVDAFKTVVDVLEKTLQHRFRNGWIAAVRLELLFVTLKVFQDVRLEIGAAAHFHDLKHRAEAEVMVGWVVALQQQLEATEQVFQTQVGADAFVERVFVKDHVKACWLSLQSREQ